MPWICTSWSIDWNALTAIAAWATAAISVAAVVATVRVGNRASEIANAVNSASASRDDRAKATLAIPLALEFSQCALRYIRARFALEQLDVTEAERFDSAVVDLWSAEPTLMRANLQRLDLFPANVGKQAALGFIRIERARGVINGMGSPVRISDGTAKPGAAAALLEILRTDENDVESAYFVLCIAAGIAPDDIVYAVTGQHSTLLRRNGRDTAA